MKAFSSASPSTLVLGSLLLASSSIAQSTDIPASILSSASALVSSAAQPVSTSSVDSMSASATSSGAVPTDMSSMSSMVSSASSSMPSATSTASAANSTPTMGNYSTPFVVSPDISIEPPLEYNYTEPYRNQYHHSPPYAWMNDPNGLLYVDGTYHLYYQYNPNGLVAANQSWGHATSTDLVHWETQPIAIVATESELIFSGSAVLDRNNTAGFSNGSSPAIVAIYATANIQNSTLGRQAISIAYSTDNGTSFTKYDEGRPVINLDVNDLRDPNVKWYQPQNETEGYWLLTAVLAEQYQVTFWRSDDLKNWTHLSEYGPGPATTGGVWECPDMIQLPDPADPSQNVSVLIVSVNPGGIAGGSGTWYITGSFENGTFTPNNRSQSPEGVENWLDFGADNYAGITFNDAPTPTFIGWMSNWWYGQEVPTYPWRSANTVPRTLSLVQTSNGTLQLHQTPVEQLNQIFTPTLPSTYGYNASNTNQSLEGVSGETLRLDAVVLVGNASTVGFNVRVGENEKTAIGFNASASEIYIDRSMSGNSTFNETVFPVYHGGPIQLVGGVVRFNILVDVASVEVFAESGSQAVLTDIIFPNASSTGVEFFVEGGDAQLVVLQASSVQSIYNGTDSGNSTSSGTAAGGATSTASGAGSSVVSTSAMTASATSTGMMSSATDMMSSASGAASSAVSSASDVFASSGASGAGPVQTATQAASSVASAAASVTQPVASIAQRYARAILNPNA
ncbi:hypothetical protein JCM10212_006599 [Sporobolomyces blumeae]